ncbi:PKD domain-containing protein [Dyadobacter sp. LHD-138]|uniref:PKD domain-containing protein n=1 Tax=Dyadobacter sp. LHD-138 TaxID=3071413 RepID=UPI0027E1E4A1|nr:T9SS type A sorting domain-containing protein [Dyadobacter sp. LHD-138]MDQ6480543.1 T9SS type A sorting domain-containing protein [Dyadobacter sp. LHD-138]
MKQCLKILLLLLLFSVMAHAQNCSINAGGDQTICLGAPINLEGSSGGPINASTLTWSVVSQPAGASVTIANPHSFNASTGISTVIGTYVFRLTVQCGDNIVTNNDVSVTVNPVPAVPTQSGTTTYSCYTGGPISISGTPPVAGETAQWFVPNGAGSFSAAGSSTTNFTPNFPFDECTATHAIDITYIITNASGCTRSATRKYSFSRQYAFSATAEPLNICGDHVLLKGSCPSNGTALWTVESAPAGAPAPVFGSASSRNTGASNLVPGNYTFRYTVSGSTCSNGTGTVNVFVGSGSPVSEAQAGDDQHFCSDPGTISLSGNTPAVGETATWSFLSGGTSVAIANPSSPNTIVSGLTSAGAPYQFTYKISAPGGCSRVDTVSIFVERELVLSNTYASTCNTDFLPSSGGPGLVNRTAQLGNFAFNELDELTVSVTYISGPASTILNYTAIGTSLNGNIKNNVPSTTIALGQTFTKKFWNTGNASSPDELYIPPTGESDQREYLSYYVVNGGIYTTVGQYKYRVTYTTKCSTYVADVVVDRGTSISVNAGSDVFLNCGATNATLAGNVIDNFATWQTVSMPAGATNPINSANHQLRNPPISGLVNGTYIFRYANNAGTTCVQDVDDVKVVVSNTPPPAPNAGVDQTVCAGSFTLNGSVIPGTALGQWSVVTPAGAPVTFSDATTANPTVSGLLASTAYTFRYTLTNGCGSSFDDVVITTNSNTAPPKPTIAITGGACSATSVSSYPYTNSVVVTHPALGTNTGALTIVVVPAGSGTATQTGSTVTSKTVQLNLSADAAVSFIWTVSNASCSGQAASDTVTTYFLANRTSVFAGNDQTLCSVSAFPFVASLNGMATAIPKNWSLLYSSNGQNVTFGSSTSSNTAVTLPADGTYRFKYEIIGADPTCSFTDYVTIVASSPGSLAQAGPDVSICNATGIFNLAATPLTAGTGVWEIVEIIDGIVPTIANVNSATSGIIFTQSGTVVLRWNSYGSNTACGPSSSDLVTVRYVAPAKAGADINLCNSTSTNLNALNAEPAIGTWSQLSGPNTATLANTANPNTLISGLVAGTYTFRWSVGLGGSCVTTDNVVVTISNISAVANAGTDFTECNASGNSTVLMNATAAPAGLTGTWTVTNFPVGASAGTFSNANDPKAVYTGATVAGNYSFAWTLSDGNCTSTDFVTVTVNPASCITISGTVFDDANGNTLIDGVDASLTIPANMYVYLVNASGVIIDVVNLGSGNTYSFGARSNASYTIELSTVQYQLGTNTNVTPIDNTPPADWVTTGENGAGNTGPGDLTPNGTLAVTTGTANVTQQNFGIEKKPVVYTAVDAARPNPGGAIQSPVTSTLFTGDDKEDGTYPANLTGREVTLSPATNGTLYYNGNPVTGPLTITNFDPTKVSVDPTATGTTTGLTGASPDPIFTYTVTDEAGVESDPKTIRVPFTTALPVTLVSFTATKTEAYSQLTWTTTEESNSDHFEVQHSHDAANWAVAGKVNASGESKAVINYAFRHDKPVSGSNYYRLKMIDQDATYAYSRIVSVRFEGESNLNVYPNPVSDFLQIKNENKQLIKSVEIIDIAGKTVYLNSSERGLSDILSKGVDISKLPSGAYVVRVSGVNGIVSTSKIIVAH